MDPSSGERNLYLTNLSGSWQTTILQLKEGEVSVPREVQLLDNSMAYHIVLLEKRIPEHTVNLETDYELIEGLALREKQGKIMAEWLTELKKDVYIDMRGQARDISIADN